MPTIMKSLSAAALLIAVLWRPSVDYRFVLSFVVTIGAIAVATQAARAQKYTWVVIFLAIATLLNPILTGALPPQVYFWTDVACLVAFASSLVALKNKAILSIASIIDRRGSESL